MSDRSDAPLVSCIMPTADRRELLPLALACFLDQTYPHRELVVLDDGNDPVEDLVPDDPMLRYVRLSRRIVLGTKRNLAVEATHGELIAHWDDDDWSHPERISRQVAALTGSFDVCGLRELLWWEPRTRQAWRYHYPGRRPWVAGNTFLYRRSAWRRSPFRPQRTGEDTAFVWGPGEVRIAPLQDDSLLVGTIHEHNTSRKKTGRDTWERVPTSAVQRVLDKSGPHATAELRRSRSYASPQCVDRGPTGSDGEGLVAQPTRPSAEEVSGGLLGR